MRIFSLDPDQDADPGLECKKSTRNNTQFECKANSIFPASSEGEGGGRGQVRSYGVTVVTVQMQPPTPPLVGGGGVHSDLEPNSRMSLILQVSGVSSPIWPGPSVGRRKRICPRLLRSLRRPLLSSPHLRRPEKSLRHRRPCLLI